MPASSLGVAVVASTTSYGNSSWVEISAGESTAIDLIALIVFMGTAAPFEVDIGTGDSGSEAVLTTFRGMRSGGTGSLLEMPHPVPIQIAASTRISVRMRIGSTAGATHNYKLAFVRN